MESDIRAKAPPGPSLVPVAGPFPEIPGRAEVESEGVGLGYQFTQALELKNRKKRAGPFMIQNSLSLPAQGRQQALLPTFTPHDQLVKEIRHQVPTLACGSHCNRKATGKERRRNQGQNLPLGRHPLDLDLFIFCSLSTHASLSHSHHVTRS